MRLNIALLAPATALALMSLGGAFYEFLVVDPFWPRRRFHSEGTRLRAAAARLS